MLLALVDDDHAEMLERVDIAFLSFFAMERCCSASTGPGSGSSAPCGAASMRPSF
jgi:hypothetical protein